MIRPGGIREFGGWVRGRVDCPHGEKKTDGGAARPREQRARRRFESARFLSNFLRLYVGFKVVVYEVGVRTNLGENGFNFYESV